MMNQYIASNCEIEEFNDYDTQAPVVQMPGTSMPPMPMMPMTPIPPMTPAQSDVPQLDSPTEDSQTDFVDTWSKIRDLAYALKCGAEDNLRCGTVVDLGRIDDIGQELNRMVQKVTEGDDNKKRLPPPLIRPRRQRKKFDEEAKTVALIKKSSGSDMYCHSCGTTDTVEWRRGPDGSKSLCNACGLHYAKMIKREMMIPNRQTQRSVMSFSNILS